MLPEEHSSAPKIKAHICFPRVCVFKRNKKYYNYHPLVSNYNLFTVSPFMWFQSRRNKYIVIDKHFKMKGSDGSFTIFLSLTWHFSSWPKQMQNKKKWRNSASGASLRRIHELVAAICWINTTVPACQLKFEYRVIGVCHHHLLVPRGGRRRMQETPNHCVYIMCQTSSLTTWALCC